jgi:WD40 repeat protein
LDLEEAEMTAQFSANGQLLAAKSGGEIRIHETHAGRVLRKFVNDAILFKMSLSPDGQTLAGGVATPPSIILWDVNTGQELMTIEPQGARLTGLAFSPQGDRLVATGVSETGEGQFWEWAVQHETSSPSGRE